jgi:hypothetical protein
MNFVVPRVTEAEEVRLAERIVQRLEPCVWNAVTRRSRSPSGDSQGLPCGAIGATAMEGQILVDQRLELSILVRDFFVLRRALHPTRKQPHQIHGQILANSFDVRRRCVREQNSDPLRHFAEILVLIE